MAIEVSTDIKITNLRGESRTIAEWTTMFHLAVVALDPYTDESSWILPTAGRILRGFSEADCRAAFLLPCSADEANDFLGPWAKELLVLLDPDRSAIKSFGITELPAFIHIDQAQNVAAQAQGWQPEQWRNVAENLATTLRWQKPAIPMPKDPVPFAGTPV